MVSLEPINQNYTATFSNTFPKNNENEFINQNTSKFFIHTANYNVINQNHPFNITGVNNLSNINSNNNFNNNKNNNRRQFKRNYFNIKTQNNFVQPKIFDVNTVFLEFLQKVIC